MFEPEDEYTFSNALADRLFAKIGQLILQNQVGHRSWSQPEDVRSAVCSEIRVWLSELEDLLKKRAERASVEEAIKERLSNGG